MEKVFLQIINMSITSTYVILCIIIGRLFLKKAPKIFSYILWSIALFRLIFPFSIESIFSLVTINPRPISEKIVISAPQIQKEIDIIDIQVNDAVPSTPIEIAAPIEPTVPI